MESWVTYSLGLTLIVSLCHHSAASTGHTDTVLVLTGAGADVNAVDDGGQGACCELLPARRLTLHCVMQRGGHLSIVRACTATTAAFAL